MKDATEVVLEDLGLIERPTVVLVLAQVKPLLGASGAQRSAGIQTRVYADVDPVAGPPTGSVRATAHPGPQRGYAVAVEQRLEVADLALLERALGQHHDVDVADLLVRRAERPVDEVEVQGFAGGELEEAERLLFKAPDRARDRAEVDLSHSQRPGQQQDIAALGLRAGARGAERQLVPADVHLAADDAGITRKGRPPGRRGPRLGKHAKEAGGDARQRAGSRQQLAA